MQLVFTKGAGKFDVMEVQRPGMAPERVQCPKQGIIPHDMVHYAVEHSLQMRGFLGRVKDGEAAGFRMQPEGESDGVERLVEVIQADQWSGGDSSVADIVDLYRVTCSARHCPALAVDAPSILAMRAAIADLTRRWEATAVGESLSLTL